MGFSHLAVFTFSVVFTISGATVAAYMRSALPSSYTAVTASGFRVRRLARRVISVRLLEVRVYIIRVQQSQVKRSSGDDEIRDEQRESDCQITCVPTAARVR